MQVSHQTDHITHAVLGGMDNMSFGISDDPAFFQVLSSSLYTDPTLAMIRETICNGWDAHIASDIAGRPLDITVDAEKLVIRDYGNGIPHELIQPIYGVYGASTKKNDGRQTGGFGLGCKSPFAYTDHFEVISCHAGKRTIYNMSKSSAEKMGKPSIIPIASFPTQETGIQVTIKLTGGSEDDRIEGLIRDVVFRGDIYATLNGETLPTLGLDTAEKGFILIEESATLSSSSLDSFHSDRIHVRYGNVVYPIPDAKQIQSLKNKVVNSLRKFYGCHLVMMAPPDSISVTPSREALTMSEITVETLKSLLTHFLTCTTKNRELSKRYESMADQKIIEFAEAELPLTKKTSFNSWHVPGVEKYTDKSVFSTQEDFAILEVMLRYSARAAELPAKVFLKKIALHLNKMVELNLVPRGHVQSWLREAWKIKKHLHSPNMYNSSEVEATIATQWWHKRIVLPLVKKLAKAMPGVTPHTLLYYGSNESVRYMHGRNSWYSNAVMEAPAVISKLVKRKHTFNLEHLLKPSVIVCHNASVIRKRLTHVAKSSFVGSILHDNYYVIEVPRSKAGVESVAELLKGIDGVEIIDLMGRLPHEESAYQDRLEEQRLKRAAEALRRGIPEKEVRVAKKARPGLIQMAAMISPITDDFDTRQFASLEDPPRIIEPVFIEKISTAADSINSSQYLSYAAATAVAKLWGNLGAVTNNQAVYDRYIDEKKVMKVSAFVIDKVVNEIATNPEIQAFHAFTTAKAEGHCHILASTYKHGLNMGRLYELLMEIPELNHLIPGFAPLSLENQLKYIVFREVTNSYSMGNDKEVRAAKEQADDVDLDKGVKAFLADLKENLFVQALDYEVLTSAIKADRHDPAKMAKISTIFTHILTK